MPSIRENQRFFEYVMPNNASFLESCIDWIKDNLSPEDVFSDDDLEKWAKDKGYILPED